MRSTSSWENLSRQDRRALERRLRLRDEVIVARFVEPDTDDEPVYRNATVACGTKPRAPAVVGSSPQQVISLAVLTAQA